MKEKNYKENYAILIMKKLGVWERKGQMAIFIIVAIVIAAVILAIFLYPRLSPVVSGEINPNNYLRSCIEPHVKENKEKIAERGGYLNPEGYLLYKDEKIKYLCYTSKFYSTCVVQEPMIKSRFEEQLLNSVNSKIEDCFSNLVKEYEKRGYAVNSPGKPRANISFVPEKINININAPIIASKGEQSASLKEFNIDINSEMYDLLMLTNSIIEYESTYGDSETTLYMQYYPDLKIEKVKLSDGSKVYTLTNVITKEKFRFASRSLSWPPGYGLQ